MPILRKALIAAACVLRWGAAGGQSSSGVVPGIEVLLSIRFTS